MDQVECFAETCVDRNNPDPLGCHPIWKRENQTNSRFFVDCVGLDVCVSASTFWMEIFLFTGHFFACFDYYKNCLPRASAREARVSRPRDYHGDLRKRTPVKVSRIL